MRRLAACYAGGRTGKRMLFESALPSFLFRCVGTFQPSLDFLMDSLDFGVVPVGHSKREPDSGKTHRRTLGIIS